MVIVGRSAVISYLYGDLVSIFPKLAGSPPTPLCGDHGGMRRHMPTKFNLEAVVGFWRGPGLRHSPQAAGSRSRVRNSDYESEWHNHTYHTNIPGTG